MRNAKKWELVATVAGPARLGRLFPHALIAVGGRNAGTGFFEEGSGWAVLAAKPCGFDGQVPCFWRTAWDIRERKKDRKGRGREKGI